MVYILLPAYNEGKNISQVLTAISDILKQASQKYLIVVVNDGSLDNTRAIVERLASQFPVELLNFEKNQGVGAVFNLGINYICQRAKDDDIIISMDCDQTHPADTIPEIINKIKQGADIVIASRYSKNSQAEGLPLIRELLSDSVNFLLRAFFPYQNAHDYTTFYRGHRLELLKKALDFYGNTFIEQPGFACMTEIFIKLIKFKPQICEVPYTLRFDRRTGKSKMKVFSTILGYLRLIVVQKTAFLKPCKHK
jgi:dolichol-phosphate mannosyltransferase